MYRVSGTMENGEEFTFTLEAPHFMAAVPAAVGTVSQQLGNRAGLVVSFRVQLIAPKEKEFRMHKPDPRTPRAGGTYVGRNRKPTRNDPQQ